MKKGEIIGQSDIYIKKDADEWFDRNDSGHSNCFTEYLLGLFRKSELTLFDVAEFGIGRGSNICLLSNYVSKIDGYDGSHKAIKQIENLGQIYNTIGGKRVNLCKEFTPLSRYNLIIYGFFAYMVTDKEFESLLRNSANYFKEDSDQNYIFIYDFIKKNKSEKKRDIHNDNLFVYKRTLDFYLQHFQKEGYTLIDFRLWDNRNLKEYKYYDNVFMIDSTIDNDDYNHVFSALFKRMKNG